MMHLIGFLINSPINHTIGIWRHDGDQRLQGLGSIDYWREVAATMERGLFDAVFFADVPAAYDQYRDSADDTVRYGVCWPNHDPIVVLGIMGTATSRLGLVATKSISGVPPYDLVRTLSTLDYVTGGRVGWNIVTGHLRAEHRALGLEQMAHDERYDRADEYLEICRLLWSGIAADAIVADKSTGEFADPAKVKRVDFAGKYLRASAIPAVIPSAQGHPVLFQAGSSSRGQTFAIRNAEVVFAIQTTEAGMHKFMRQLRDAAVAEGLPEPKVTFGVQPVLGATEGEAKALQRQLAEAVPLAGGMARLSGTLGVDFSKLDPDQPMVEQKTQASQGMAAATSSMNAERPTLRQAALSSGISTNMLQLVGTPEQVAAQLERIWRETGCHGFNVTPTINNRSMVDFVDHVVPILQKRGVYRHAYPHATLRQNLMEDRL